MNDLMDELQNGGRDGCLEEGNGCMNEQNMN